MSANGGIVALVSNIVTYIPPLNFAGIDSFSLHRIGWIYQRLSGVIYDYCRIPSQETSLSRFFNPLIAGGNLKFKFAGGSGLTYTVESAPALQGPWSKVANVTVPLTSEGLGEGVFQFQAPAAGDMKFYRVIYPLY